MNLSVFSRDGLDFSFEYDHKTGEISSLRNYLMKYLAETFIETLPRWTPEELVFNAVPWRNGYRFFGCSHGLPQEIRG